LYLSSTKKKAISWDAYASQYDLLAAANPSYAENIEIVRAAIASLDLPAGAVVCDVGGGTGNFTCALSEDMPDARFVHLDADAEMNRIASAKFVSLGVRDVSVVGRSVFDVDFANGSFDLILCINALYSMVPQDEVLDRIRRWLKPDGRFVVIDFGRRTKVFDWGRFILGNMIKEKGLVESLRFLRKGLETLKQNRRGSKGQAEGIYWLHSTEEFGRVLTGHGFIVDELRTCYRGYCDLALCRPDSSSTSPPQSP
jgi:ubiquinone/menaquinone biosynthesis C-methylase UbiE